MFLRVNGTRHSLTAKHELEPDNCVLQTVAPVENTGDLGLYILGAVSVPFSRCHDALVLHDGVRGEFEV